MSTISAIKPAPAFAMLPEKEVHADIRTLLIRLTDLVEACLGDIRKQQRSLIETREELNDETVGTHKAKGRWNLTSALDTLAKIEAFHQAYPTAAKAGVFAAAGGNLRGGYLNATASGLEGRVRIVDLDLKKCDDQVAAFERLKGALAQARQEFDRAEGAILSRAAGG